jgi:site-specific DNA-cytosine methylase
VDHPFDSPTILSLCPGILGLERGLERAIGPVRVAAYCEREAFICENLVAGMEAGLLAPAPIWTDVKTFPAEAFSGKIHGIIGGYPCQPFSTAGLRKGTDDPRHLFPHILRHIKQIRPIWCFFENVRGHLTMGYDEVYRSLREAGYDIECGIYSAEEVGAPHKRDRLFILAILADAKSAGIWGGAGDVYKKDGRSNDELQFIAERAGLSAANSDGAKWRQSAERRVNEHDGTYRGRKEAASRPELCSPKLAHPNSNGPGTNPRGVRCESGSHESSKQRKKWDQVQRERGGGHAGDVSSEMGDTHTERFQADGRCTINARFPEAREGGWDSAIHAGHHDRWPARPGNGQFDWEAPHTIESGMGCSIDGYNFREDLLRALGNSVVEQTAEFAFKDLLRKHLESCNNGTTR